MLQEEEFKMEDDDTLRATLDLDEQDEPDVNYTTAPCLSLPLQVLFSLNGATLSLPSTALMYIVNTRAAVPLVYLSVYGALAFLPNSLKPLYAYLSDFFSRRDFLLTVLLFLSGVSIVATALVPTGGVVWCFVLAFAREVFSAWPEFLLGVTMLEEASATGDFTSKAAMFQSQAATARNAGSLTASMLGFLFFLYRHFYATGEELSDAAVNIILAATGSINLVGAVFSAYNGVGYNGVEYSQPRYTRLETSVPNTTTTAVLDETTTARTTNMVLGDATLIVLLQLLVVFFAMRGPVVSATSVVAWNSLLLVLVAAMIVTVGINYDKWSRSHRVGFFLIVRHAIPSSGFMMSSFVYSLFQSTPMVLQLFHIFSGGITTLSSWSYGRLLAQYSSGTKFLAVIAGTTVLAALLSLLDILVVGLDKDDNRWRIFATMIAVSVFTTFSKEWSFLPSVVLATTAVTIEEDNRSDIRVESDKDSENPEAPASYQQMKVTCCECKGPTASIGMQYGVLVSCLDFGDQIGSWLTMPLVAAFGISRENDWAHMDTFILATAFLSLIPLALLPIVRN
jgi:hypothetical protein